MKNFILPISAASIFYTVWFYSNALLQVNKGNVQGSSEFYPWFVAQEGIALFVAAAIPFAAALRPGILKHRSILWIGIICIAYGLFISINFFIQMGAPFGTPHTRVGLRLLSWIALALLTYWTLRKQISEQDDAGQPM